MKTIVHFVSIVAASVSLGACAVELVPYAKVTGTGNDDTRVSGGKFTVEPNTPYVLSCAMRHPAGNDTGVAVIIPARTSMYWHPKGNDWQVFTNAFLSVSDAAREEEYPQRVLEVMSRRVSREELARVTFGRGEHRIVNHGFPLHRSSSVRTGMPRASSISAKTPLPSMSLREKVPS